MALAAGLPLLVAGIVMAVVFTGTGVVGSNPLHRAVDEYLDAVGSGGPAPAAGPQSRCPHAAGDPAAVLHSLATTFEHHIVSSTASADDASVNVDLTPGDGDPIAVVLDLRRTGDRWDVCAASTGQVSIDPF
ncbi:MULTISPECIES: hypothetical protein [unclassified Streptomyces]|uniref:hypothetical protein n=1 Tax=unclassified Streptomyces TaxID=2593676 RepID=UPI002271EAE5|nr:MULTISPECIES: hypothetical protein [unclassified Streptomyces]MCY0918964.1 hypothetical protein [Streptomyces sp. H27-G5]MCY0963296.1 hypothetical protein [Streptomyces sp. H27-H5]